MRSHRLLSRHWQVSEQGQGLVEYALILVLVSVVCIVILSVMGSSIADVFCRVATTLGGGTSVSVTGTSPQTIPVELEAGATITFTATTTGGHIVNMQLLPPGGGSYLINDPDQTNDDQGSITYTTTQAGSYGVYVDTALISGTGHSTSFTLTYGDC